jgi:hypothetical protein
MDYLTTTHLVWAVALGAISAVSLPLGSLVGLQTQLRPGYISALAAFGAGALIAALSVELVASGGSFVITVCSANSFRTGDVQCGVVTRLLSLR